MAFGIDSGISRETRNSVQVANKIGPHGEVLEMSTHGGMKETTEETYGDSLTNEATNMQVGNTSTSVVAEHSFIESNADYARIRKRSQLALAAVTTTTTTTGA